MKPESFVTRTCDLCGSDQFHTILEKEGSRYVKCDQCHFVFTNPQPVNALSINNEIFDERLERYAAKYKSKNSRKSYLKVLRSLEPYRKTNRLLEVGSNVGAFLFRAKQAGWAPLGIEPAEACVRYGKVNYGLEMIAGTLEEVQLPENAFDVVYANAVFEHLPSPSRAFRVCRQALRPGGVLLVDTVNYDSYTRERLGENWKLLEPRGHLSLFSPATLRLFCKNTGFDVVWIRTRGFRLRPNNARRLRGWRRWAEELRKLPMGLLCRATLKGDSIALLAQKPE